MEKYQPTPDDLAKAEGMMTEEQRAASDHRENLARGLESIGKKGHVSLENDLSLKNEQGPGHKMVGEINGHRIEITNGGLIPYDDAQFEMIKPGGFSGTVDGQELSVDDARRLYERYRQYSEVGWYRDHFAGQANESLDREAEAVGQDKLKRSGVRGTVEELLA